MMRVEDRALLGPTIQVAANPLGEKKQHWHQQWTKQERQEWTLFVNYC